MNVPRLRSHRAGPAARLSAALLLMTGHAGAAPPVTFIIGGRAAPSAVAPFVADGGAVCAPIEMVQLLGGHCRVDRAASTVTVTGAGGQTVTVSDIRRHGQDFFPLQAAAGALGADVDWQAGTQTLTLRARLEMVRRSTAGLSIVTSYPVSYHVQALDAPNRVFVDLDGLTLAAAPATIPVAADGSRDDVTRLRSGQIDFNTVRITMDLKSRVPFRVVSGPQTDRIQVALDADGDPAEPSRQVAQTPALAPMPVTPAEHSLSSPVMPAPPPTAGVQITSVGVRRVSDALTQIVVTATGPAPYRTETLRSPDRLAFDLVGAGLAPGVSESLPVSGSIVKAVRAGLLRVGAATFGRVVVDLSRLAGFSVSRQPGDGGATTYLVSLSTPLSRPASVPGGANSLAGKRVVIDPGHGAQDSGAVAPDGSMEKTFTLSIGLKLRDALARDGATVFMTRADDSFLPVQARPQFAVARDADYFISVHCDSSGPQNSHSGTTVYFHARSAVCRRMASDILNRVAEVSGLPAAGVKSDTIRFQSGFGVLRGSPMPAVLVECGYVNSDADLAKLKQDATQQHIAEGIVAGLRDFIADRSAR